MMIIGRYYRSIQSKSQFCFSVILILGISKGNHYLKMSPLNIQILLVGLVLGGPVAHFVNSQSACGDEDSMDPPECPPDGGGESVYFPYPYDCRKYYECSNGAAVCFLCPPGTVWDQSLPGCNHELVVPCVIVTTPPPTGTTAQTTPTSTTSSITESSTTPSTAEPPTSNTPTIPTTTSPPSNQIVVDVRDDIPETGVPLTFDCYLGYAPSPSDFFCGAGDRVDFPPEDLHGEEGFWTKCYNECEISYQSQPDHTHFLARLYQRNAQTEIIIDGFYDFIEGDGWVEYGMKLDHTEGNHTITLLLDIHGEEVYTLLDKIVISTSP